LSFWPRVIFCLFVAAVVALWVSHRTARQMELPTPNVKPDREWSGQRFVLSRAADATWAQVGATGEPLFYSRPGWEARDTTVADSTKDVAGVWLLRPHQAHSLNGDEEVREVHEQAIAGDGEIEIRSSGIHYLPCNGGTFATPLRPFNLQ
jgi:hypothetical protein